MNGDLSKCDIATLLRGFTRGMRGKWEKPDYEALMAWATEAKLNAELLELVLEGYMDPFIDDQGVLRFLTTEKGRSSRKAPQLERIGT